MLDPKCIYRKRIFAKCTRLACLLSFASLFALFFFFFKMSILSNFWGVQLCEKFCVFCAKICGEIVCPSRPLWTWCFNFPIEQWQWFHRSSISSWSIIIRVTVFFFVICDTCILTLSLSHASCTSSLSVSPSPKVHRKLKAASSSRWNPGPNSLKKRNPHRPVLSRGETIDSCCSEETDPVTVLEVCHDGDDHI